MYNIFPQYLSHCVCLEGKSQPALPPASYLGWQIQEIAPSLLSVLSLTPTLSLPSRFLSSLFLLSTCPLFSPPLPSLPSPLVYSLSSSISLLFFFLLHYLLSMSSLSSSLCPHSLYSFLSCSSFPSHSLAPSSTLSLPSSHLLIHTHTNKTPPTFSIQKRT